MKQVWAVLYTFLKVGLVGALAVLSQFNWNVFELTSKDWKVVATAAIAAVGVAIWKALDKSDPSYGRGASK